MAISDKEQIRRMMIALLEIQRMRDTLARIDELLTQMPPQQVREQFLILAIRSEIATALRRIENL